MQLSPSALMLVLLCTMILLPIVPAYLLFHALPNSAEVEGPWQGLQIKLGGAFAGYFLTVLAIFTAYEMVKPNKQWEVWQVTGNITDANGADIGPISAQDFSADPSWLPPPEGSSFRMYVFTQTGPGGAIVYPTIYLNHNGKRAKFNLDPTQQKATLPANVTFYPEQHMVSIKDVHFADEPQYNSNAPVVNLP